MRLYRVKSTFALKAFDKLGTFYLESRREGKAVEYLGAAANAVVSKIMTNLEHQNPSYSYTTLSDLLNRARGDDEIVTYIEEVELYRLLYSLGDALYLATAKQSAFSVWTSIAGIPEAGVWKTKASRRLLKP
jgi:hypothetical protein